MSFYYSLDHECYTWKNALLWGNCIGHLNKAREGKLGDRIVHAVIALVEMLPIVSQIASIAEKIFVRGMNFNPSKTHHLSNKSVVKVDDKSSASSQENRQVENPDRKEEEAWQQALARCEDNSSHPANRLCSQALTHCHAGELEEAENLFNQGFEQYQPNPVPAKWLYTASQVQKYLNNTEKASKLRQQADIIYTHVLKVCPPHEIPVDVLAMAACTKLDMEKFKEADLLFTQILTQYGKEEHTTFVLTSAATTKHALGQHKEANALIQEELAKYAPGQAPAWIVEEADRIRSQLDQN